MATERRSRPRSPTPPGPGLAPRACSTSSPRSIARAPRPASERRPSGWLGGCAELGVEGADRVRARARHLLVAARDRRGGGRGRRARGAARAADARRRGSAAAAGARRSSTTCRRVGAGAAAAAARGRARPRGRELGPADAERTVVLVAHHDAAALRAALPSRRSPSGLDRLPGLIGGARHQPAAHVAPVVGGPAAVAAGAATGSRALTQAGDGALGRLGRRAGRHRARDVVPGANDNATGVAALLAVARALVERPAREPARDAGLDLRGGDLRRDAGVRAASLPGAAAWTHLLPLPRHPRLAAPARSSAARACCGCASTRPIAGPARRPGRGARDRAVPEPAAAQRHRRRRPARRRLRVRRRSAPAPASSSRPTTTGRPTCRRTSTTTRVADAVRLTEAVVRRLDERWL